MSDVNDELRFLAQSTHRSTVLELLSEAEPRSRAELEARVDATRRTINRAVQALETRGYLDETTDGCRLTAFGAALADAHAAFASEAATNVGFRPFLEHVSAETFDLDPGHLEGADLLLASESSPFALLDRTLALRRDATHIRELAPAVEKKSVTQLSRRLDDEPLDVEIVLPASTASEAASNPDYSDAHRTIEQSDGVELYVYPDETSLFIGLFDETATLGAINDGRPHALVESTDPRVIEWAARTFRQYRSRSRRQALEAER